MANTKYKGVNYTGLNTTIPTLIEEGEYGGIVRNWYDSFTLTADLASGDTILMGSLLPEGARLLDCKIVTGALGGSCTINVGWQASADATEAAQASGFFAALPVSSASYTSAWNSTSYGGGSTFYQKILKGSVQPVIAENAVSSGATGILIQMEIYYVTE